MHGNLGRKQNKEWKEKRIKAVRDGGKLKRPRGPLSPETRVKISEANKGNKPAPQTISASIKARQGKPSKLKGKPNLRMRGEKNHLWRGGITPINARIRTSLEYKIWRRAVFERDNFACVWCGDRQKEGHKVVIHADHIKPFAYFPELRFAIDNGRTLCISCHKTTESYLKKTVNGLA